MGEYFIMGLGSSKVTFTVRTIDATKGRKRVLNLWKERGVYVPLQRSQRMRCVQGMSSDDQTEQEIKAED
jgi:hypothetical protein